MMTASALRWLRNSMIYIVLIGVALILMIPVIWLLITSLKAEHEYVSDHLVLWPQPPQWQNYYLAVTRIDFLKYVRNSAVLSTIFAGLTVTTSAMAGYAFARIPAWGRSRLFSVVVATLLIPGSIYVIPQFIFYSQLRITNSYWPWVLWGLAASPFHIFLFRQFFQAFPVELEEAAEMDGARIHRIFLQIVLPNALPAVATSFILNFLGVWGDWVMTTLYLTDENTTLAVKLISSYFNPQGYPLITPTLAAAVLYVLPPVLVFFLMQKYIMQGVVTSGLKG